jgi:hypothetical protein
MATITQRLAFLISANADGAIKAFDKTAQQADKQLGKAQKSIDKLGVSMTRFGATGLAAAGTLGAGLFRLAQGAIEDQKAQALLAEQLRTSTGATEAQIAAVEKSIDAMARATGVADDRLRPALGNLVRATGDVSKAQQLLQTSMDISAATGRDLEAVTLAISRAATGNIGALSRLGIPLDENVKKSKDFDAALQALNAQFGGAAAVAADTYAGKMARAQVAISEAGESLGSAFIPFVEKAANAISTGVGAFDKLNGATSGAIGKFAAFGTVGLGAVSALSLVAGQAIKLRERFTELGEDGVRSINKVGRAAQLLGGTLATLAVSEAAFAFFNNAVDASGKVERALQKVQIALAKTDTTVTVEQFRNLVKQEDGVLRFSNIISDFGKEVTIVGGESSRNIEDIDRAFSNVLKNSGPEAAKGLIEALAREAASLDKNSQQYKDNMMLVDRYRGRINLLTEAQKANNEVNKVAPETVSMQMRLAFARETQSDTWDRYFDSVKKATGAESENTKKTKENTDATKKNTEAKAKFAQKVAEAAQALRDQLNTALESAKDKLKDATDAYNNYSQTVSGAISGTVNLGNAQSTAAGNAESLASAQTAVADAQKEYNDAIRTGDTEKITDAYTKLTDAQKALNAESAKPQGFLAVLKQQEQQASTFATNIERLLGAGLSQAALDQVIASGADAGNAIATELLTGADPAGKIAEVNRIVSSTQTIADRVAKAASDKFYQAGVDQATALVNGMQSVFDAWTPVLGEGAVDSLLNPLKTIGGYSQQVSDAIAAATTGMAPAAPVEGKKKKKKRIPKLAEGGIVQAEAGGRLVLLGEGGRDEAVVPLPASGLPGSGMSITVNVNAGLGADGTQIGKEIVDVLQAYQRRVGALPIKVAG